MRVSIRHPEPRTKNQEPRTKSQEPRTKVIQLWNLVPEIWFFLRGGRAVRPLFLGIVCALVGNLTGCVWEWDQFNIFHPPKPPPGPAESLLLQGDRPEPQTGSVEGTAKGDLAGAHELFRRGEYAKAEKAYDHI